MVTAKSECGIVYGKHQLNCHQVTQFIQWIASKGSCIACLVLEHYTPGSCEFNAWWEDMEMISEFQGLQDKFIGDCV